MQMPFEHLQDQGFRETFMIVPTLRAVVADDESLARKKLRLLLGAECGVKVVAECEDGKQTIAAVLNHKPDVLLLDIQMPDYDGFQVLSRIPPDQVPIVIFTTAYDQYAIRAFEAHALDYLLKPFDQDRLHRALERARTELLKSHDRNLQARILRWLGDVRPTTQQERLVIRTGGRVVFLDVNEVDWIEAAANYVKLHVGKESYLLREGIGRISERLNPERFVRIHRSLIANVSRIKELQPCESGEYIAVLKDGKELSCSRGYRLQLQRLIDGNI
jgi:two-component system, LytTR family, response regulator